MHKHDEHTVNCDQYVAKGPSVSRSKAGYRSSQWMIGVVNSGLVTVYRFPSYDNWMFWGHDARTQTLAEAYAECSGGKYRPVTRPASEQVYHVVRFDHHA